MIGWTAEQSEAIYAPSGEGNILVSAAAGSGKTAVLVERIVNMITREENPVSADELLVVTFTEAAAAEMKERIVSRLGEERAAAAKSGDGVKAAYLREQIHLTALADINTIDSFCLSVVKNNFHVLGIDPNFGIMDENEGKILMDDALDELFDALYALEDDNGDKAGFLRLTRAYASNRSDEGLKEVIRNIYRFIQSMPEPLAWLREKADMYGENAEESAWVKDVLLGSHRESIIREHEPFWDELIRGMKAEAEEKCGSADACGKWWGTLWGHVNMCAEAVRALKDVNTCAAARDFYGKYIVKKSILGNAVKEKIPKKDAPDADWRRFYRKYDFMRDNLRERCALLPRADGAELDAAVHSKELKQSAEDIVRFTELLTEAYDKKKDKRSVKSFSDIEHLAYMLFSNNENIRTEYARKYREILIDEYQDTNGLQDAIFSSISRGNKNMFMVGDLKQSIYRFRGGDPMIFRDKSKRYSDSSDGRRVILSQNFRSRSEVLDGVNAVFSALMSSEVGDVEYSGKERLDREKETKLFPDAKGDEYKAELCRIAVIKDETDADVAADRAEAAFAADRIRSLIDEHFQVFDGGICRDVKYRDIVILVRSVRGGGDIIREMLESRGIPAYVQKEEYFSRREITLMLSLLSLINNHMQDIPLTAVMRSPIGGFSENELALIRAASRHVSFYRAVKMYKGTTEKEKRLEGKCRRFLGDLDRWRSYARIKPIAPLIWTLYEETGLYDFMGALEGGEEAQANLRLLYERAKKYEDSGFKGIFNFIRYIERMESRSEDISGANLISENYDAVRIMTMHKSKGLEFPIVFLMNTSKKTLSRSREGKIPLSAELGFGLDYYNYEKMYCKRLMFGDCIRGANKREYMSEEMRLLYVAMTRAKEKLIVTSARAYADSESYAKRIDEWSSVNVGIDTVLGASSPDDWIIAAASHSDFWQCSDSVVSSLEYEKDEEEEPPKIEVENRGELDEAVGRLLGFKYKYLSAALIPAKTSVTAIKEMEDELNPRGGDKPVYMVQKPKFLRGSSTGAEVGTAHHNVMAFIDIDKIRVSEDYGAVVRSEVERIVAEGQIDKDIAADEDVMNLICGRVAGFFESGIGKRMLGAKNVYREKQFEIEISAREYDPSLGEEIEDEKIIVQGIIDLYFEENNGDIILVDYKTDKCQTEEEQKAVAQKYAKQLELYARAMEKILKRKVKEKYVYLFAVGNAVKL